MPYTLVTVMQPGTNMARDYEIPSTLTASEILSLMREQLRLNPALLSRYRLRANPPGRLLSPEETLSQAGVWDGAVLTVCL